MQRLNSFFVGVLRKYTPDPFVFAIGITFFVIILAMLVEGQGFISVTQQWGNGFWDLLAFTMQMSVILVMGYVLASAPIVDRVLNKIVSRVHKPKSAIMMATFVSSIAFYLNWGFGLVVGVIFAKKLALNVKGVHYPLIITSAYTGIIMYGFGLSSTIPLTISTEGHTFENLIGIISLNETVFSLPILVTAVITMVTLPFVNSMLHPKKKEDIVEINRDNESKQKVSATVEANIQAETLASRLNNSNILGKAIGALGVVYIVTYFVQDGALNINIINFIILFLGILLQGSPANYIAKLGEGIKTIAGIVLQYPFYAGIMGILVGTGLVGTIANYFITISSAETLPFWGLISAYFVNMIAPSAGGQWVVQGPVMLDAANSIGANFAITSMSVQLGDAWNNIVQPFWIIPVLALAGVKLKEIMGYLVIPMLWIGVVFISSVLIWGFLG